MRLDGSSKVANSISLSASPIKKKTSSKPIITTNFTIKQLTLSICKVNQYAYFDIKKKCAKLPFECFLYKKNKFKLTHTFNYCTSGASGFDAYIYTFTGKQIFLKSS